MPCSISKEEPENAANGNRAVEPIRMHLPAYNQLSDARSKSIVVVQPESRRNSVAENRKSWDGVGYPGESEED